MLPSLATQNPNNGLPTNSEAVSQDVGSYSFGGLVPNSSSLVGIQSSQMGCASPTRGYVGHVVGLGSKDQVGWVATRRVVAGVSHAHTSRDRAVGNLPGNAMTPLGTTLLVTHRAVPKLVQGATGPRPAVIRAPGSIDVRPQALSQRHSQTGIEGDKRIAVSLPSVVMHLAPAALARWLFAKAASRRGVNTSSVGSEVKMARIATDSTSAGAKNEKSVWNGSIGDCPGNSMSPFTSLAVPDHSTRIASPKPTCALTARPIHTGPQTLLQGSSVALNLLNDKGVPVFEIGNVVLTTVVAGIAGVAAVFHGTWVRLFHPSHCSYSNGLFITIAHFAKE